jgi:hypothetical protein
MLMSDHVDIQRGDNFISIPTIRLFLLSFILSYLYLVPSFLLYNEIVLVSLSLGGCSIEDNKVQ